MQTGNAAIYILSIFFPKGCVQFCVHKRAIVMRKILFLACMLFSVALSAQSVTGNVKSADGKVLANATVQLLRSKDSSVAKLGVTDDKGNYKLENLKSGKYFISISYVGFDKNTSKVFDLTETDNVVLPLIELSKANGDMNNVTVSARKPMIEVKADKTVLNVENSINAVGQDALELLRKAPGVLVDKDDNISLSGKNGVQVYIDGKPSPLSGKDLSDFLKTMQSNQIESVEVITNPSAKYDAAGNAGIINIKLKKNKAFGTNGSVNAGYNIGIFPKYNSGISLNHRNKKINVFSNYNFNSNLNENFMNLYRTLGDTLFDQRSVMRFQGISHGFKAGLDYFINNTSTIGIMANGNISNNVFSNTSSTDISYTKAAELVKILKADNRNDMNRSNLNLNTNYRYADTSGRELNIDADYGRYRIKGDQLQPNYYFDKNGNASSQLIYNMLSPTDIDIYSLKSDYERNFKKGRLGLGGKISYVDSKNDFQRYNVFTSGKVMDTLRSNNFHYKENINAVYANYNKQYKGFMVQLGLRVENTNATGKSTGYTGTSGNYKAYDSSFTRSYTDLFPSAAVTFNKNPKSQWSVTYSRRIDRPSYQDLNPFEFKLDEYTFQKGNTQLTPQYTNSIGITHTYNFFLTTTLNYSHVDNVFSQFIDTTEKSKSFITKKNLAKQNIVSLNVSMPFQYKWYNMFLNVNAYYTKYNADFGPGRQVDLDAYAVNIYGQQSFKLNKTFTAELSGFYSSPSIWQGTFQSKEMWSMDAGLMANLMKGKMNIKATVTDVFQTQRWRGVSDFAGQKVIASGGWESRQFRLNLTYRFGNMQVKSARQRKTAADEESKRVGGGSGGGIGG